jgi:hypothetical protein
MASALEVLPTELRTEVGGHMQAEHRSIGWFLYFANVVHSVIIGVVI